MDVVVLFCIMQGTGVESDWLYSVVRVVTNRIAAMAWSEASVSRVIGMSGIQWHRTGAEVNASFMWRNVAFSCSPKCHGTVLRQRLVRGCEILE